MRTGGRRVFGFTQERPGFYPGLGWVRFGAPWSRRVHSWLTRVRTGCRSVHSVSLGSPGCALGVVRFIWGRWCAPCLSTGSFGVVGLIGVRPGGLWVHPRSLDSLTCVLRIVGNIRCLWVHCGEPLGSSGSFGVDGFIPVRSFVVAGFIGVRQAAVCIICGHWVHSGPLWRSSGSSRVAGFIGVRPAGGRVHPESLGTSGCALRVVGFVQSRRVHRGAHWESSGSFGVVVFIGVRPGFLPVHLVL